MIKRFLPIIIACITPLVLCAQTWTTRDSLRLQRMLHGKEEIRLNPEILKDIDREMGVSRPISSTEKSWMLPDESLPAALPNALPLNAKRVLTLRPYQANTPYNWDPVNERRIRVRKDTWRSDPFYQLRTLKIYTDWAKTPLSAGQRHSVTQIEASGLRYNPLAGRLNNAMVGEWQRTSGPSRLDLMTPFTKEFWDRKGNIRRNRTLEVLKAYGDSVTLLIPGGVLPAIVR